MLIFSFLFDQSLCGKIVSRGVYNHEQLQGNSSLLYGIGLCCALPIIPNDFITEAFSVVRREVMTDQLLMEILNELQLNHLNNPLKCYHFSACGNYFRSSNARYMYCYCRNQMQIISTFLFISAQVHCNITYIQQF